MARPGALRFARAALRRLAGGVALGALCLTGCSTSTPTAAPTATALPTRVPATLTATPPPTATSTPSPTPFGDAVVTADRLHVRAGPDTRHPILGSLQRDDGVAVQGRTADGTWYAVSTRDEQGGWIHSAFVAPRRTLGPLPTVPTPSPPPPPTATAAPMDPALPVVLHPSVVAQGDPFLVRVTAPEAAQAVAALDPHTVPLFPTGDGRYAGFLAAPMESAPGGYDVHVTTADASGEPSPLVAGLTVRDAGFPVEVISLTTATSGLLDPQLREAELARLQPVWTAASPDRLWHGVWRVPLGTAYTSRFGALRTYLPSGLPGRHTGLDLRGSGVTVTAPAGGRVVLAEGLTVRGVTVVMDHGWGVFSAYFHLQSASAPVGTVLETGAPVGTVGATGMTTGPHLHWEVRVHGVPVDPAAWLRVDFSAVP